jgi:hypothetical protein
MYSLAGGKKIEWTKFGFCQMFTNTSAIQHSPPIVTPVAARISAAASP